MTALPRQKMEIAVSKLEPEYQNLKVAFGCLRAGTGQYVGILQQDSKGQPITKVASPAAAAFSFMTPHYLQKNPARAALPRLHIKPRFSRTKAFEKCPASTAVAAIPAHA